MRKLMIFLPVILLLIASQPASALTYTGSFSETSGGVIINDSYRPIWEGFDIEWTITEVGGSYWNYHYQFTYNPYDIIHVIFEVSPNTNENDFWGAPGIAVNWWGSPGGPDRFMPSPMYGLRLSSADVGSIYEFEFNSYRSPVWGDFYAKDGIGGEIFAYNSDFGNPDPLDPAQDGLLLDGAGAPIYKILRPDTVIPEPSTLLLLGSALGLAGGVRRFLKK